MKATVDNQEKFSMHVCKQAASIPAGHFTSYLWGLHLALLVSDKARFLTGRAACA